MAKIIIKTLLQQLLKENFQKMFDLVKLTNITI